MSLIEEPFSRDYDDGFYQGVGSSNEVPDVFDVGINGRGYMLDQAHPAFGGQSAYLGRMGIETIPFLRTQADNSDEPGSATLNPDDLWTRSQSSWHKGAGQQYLDSKDSDRDRFRQSFGVDPWTKGQISPLNTASQIYNTTSVTTQILRVGNFLYVADGTALKYATTPYSSWTTSSIAPANSILSLASDGFYIYAATQSGGVARTQRGSNASDATSWNALACTLIAYVNGRLMAANGNVVYNITSSATPTALFTNPNADFTYVGFAEGNNCIYSAGYSGDKSVIYRTGIKTDGTGLDATLVAGVLPDGEIIKSIAFYLGFIIIGTNKGLRMATATSNGDLVLGAYVSTNGSPVRAFEPQDRFVWFGWENYDAFHTGLGRADLSQVSDDGAPAYASDLMVGSSASAVQGSITSIATDLNDKRVFAVAGQGIYLETSTPVDTCSLDAGQLEFGVVAQKIALRFGVKHKPLAANTSVNVYVNGDDAAAPTPIGSSSSINATTTDKPLKVPEIAAVLYEVHLELVGDVTFQHYEFKAYPVAPRGRTIHVPILLHETVLTATERQWDQDVRGEYDYIESLVGTNTLVSYQELGYTYSALIEDMDFQRMNPCSDRKWWNGTLLLTLKVLGD